MNKSNQKIIVQIPKSIYIQVKQCAEQIDMPVASFISMAVADTLISTKLEVSLGNRRKREKEQITIHISLDSMFYDKIRDFVEEYDNYTIREFVIDCAEFKLKMFEEFRDIKCEERAKRLRILKAESTRYSEETIKNNSVVSLVEMYIEAKARYWGISKGVIKKYYLARMINYILKTYTEEKSVFEKD